MPLVDVVGSAVKVAPAQIAATGAKLGVMFGFTVIVKSAVVAHCPPAFATRRSSDLVLSKAGDQVPLMPLVDVVGSAVKVDPAQIPANGAKLGVTFGFTVIVKSAVVAHCPAAGVKV